jgi:hypothetical protein
MPEHIRAQVAGGTWEVLGVDRNPGIIPEGIAPTWGPNGPDALTFSLRRDPNIEQPDLAPFTPIDYMPDGSDRVTWSGYLLEAPASEDAISVNARGWRHYLEDDRFSRVFIHSDMTGWQDVRSRLEAPLAKYTTGWQVNVGDGAATIGYSGAHPSGGGTTRGGILIDLGPGHQAEYIEFDYLVAGSWASTATLRSAVGNDLTTVLAGGGTLQDLISLGGPGTPELAQFYATGRYLVIFVESNVAQNPEATVRIQGLRVYGDDADVGVGITASKAIATVPSYYPQLSQDVTQIDATALVLNHVVASDETGGTFIERLNGYHSWRWKIDERRRLVFKALPDRPVLVVDLAKPGADWKDASASSGADFYDEVVVLGQSGAGVPLRVRRTYTVATGLVSPLAARGRVRTYRLEVGSPTDETAMADLGDAFLRSRGTTTLKGTLTISSDTAVRRISDDAPVPVGDLGIYTTELILLENLVDPDTGDLGRNGVLATVNRAGDTASIGIDNDRRAFDALLARMGAV